MRKNSTKWVWVLASMIIGVSVPYFLIDAGIKIVSYVKGGVEGEKVTPKTENLGSEENLEIEEDTTDDRIGVNVTVGGMYYFTSLNYKVPKTNSVSYLVADIETGEVIIEKNPETVYPIASVSKLITALVAKQNMDLHTEITVSKRSLSTYGGSGGLRVGQKVLLTDLLYPMLMESSNDVAEVISEGLGDRDVFLEKMNEFAKKNEMNNTTFDDPSGLSENNKSTAKDLLKLAMFINKNNPEIWDITRVRQFAIENYVWGNANRLIRKDSFIGGKNGFTYEAHKTTVSLFDVPVENARRKIAIIILKTDDREGDADRILRFLERNVGFLAEGETLGE